MKIFLSILKILIIVYLLLCALLFFFQEKLIFFPQKLDKDYQFNFHQKFEEIKIKTDDGKELHGLLFKVENSKGLIFYLHGNAGCLSSWGDVAKTYTNLNYDVFLIDYRGYGKSEGSISSQKQFFSDVQMAYNQMLNLYSEDKIVVLGYSIGTGLATKLAATNHPKLLILQAPFYSLTDVVKRLFPVVPTFILKYKFENYRYIQDCQMPIVIFHGNKDEVIYYQSSVKLKEVMKSTDRLITLDGQRHNGMTDNPKYLEGIRAVLE
ncbi:MAG: alpha/beta fold hydrolase [Bacteroidales bacterium]|nr:alpha/beta fold hydrolase [Bacteroidales bacterium]